MSVNQNSLPQKSYLAKTNPTSELVTRTSPVIADVTTRLLR